MLEASKEFSLTKPDAAIPKLSEAVGALRLVVESASEPPRSAMEALYCLIRSLLSYVNWIHSLSSGLNDAATHLDAAKAHAEIGLSITGIPPPGIAGFPLIEHGLRQASSVSKIGEVKDVMSAASRIAVPIPQLQMINSIEYFANSGVVFRGDENVAGPVLLKSDSPKVIALLAQIDGQPWLETLSIQAGQSFSMVLSGEFLGWPEDCDQINIRFTHTLPPEHLKVGSLSFVRDGQEKHVQFKIRSETSFPVPQSILSDPIELRPYVEFSSTTDSQVRYVVEDVVGCFKLRARITDPKTSAALSKYPVINTKIVEVVDSIRKRFSHIPANEIADFCDMMSAIGNFQGQCLQEARYKKGMKVSESTFQQELLRHLRTILPASEVLEAPRLGGGPTDIHFRTVIVENKVADSCPDRPAFAKKHEAQLAQYSAGKGVSLSILCVLDLSVKHAAPAQASNSILLSEASAHGFPDGTQHPTFVTSVFVEGAMPNPSDYAKDRRASDASTTK